MRYNKPNLINEIANIVNRYRGFSGVASQDYVIETENNDGNYTPLQKGQEFDLFIEYGDPETCFYIELYIKGKRSAEYYWEDRDRDLKECKYLIEALISNNDVTSEVNPNYKPTKPYEPPRITLEGKIDEVKEQLRHYKYWHRVNVLCSYEDVERNFATCVIEYERLSDQERDYLDEQYLLSEQYENDCKMEKWDWIKNEY